MRSNYFYLRNFLSLQASIVCLSFSLIIIDCKSTISSIIDLVSVLLPLTSRARLVMPKKASKRSIDFLASSVTTSRDREVNSF